MGESFNWRREAEFGYETIKEDVFELAEGSAVLEVGCGTGILASMVLEARPELFIEGIEPFGSGFAQLESMEEVSTVSIHRCGYEEFKPSRRYNLVYCVNVLEHLPNWRDFIDKVSEWLVPGSGKLIILCPNYNIPYESHFRIPIVVNKDFTYFLFRALINNREKTFKSFGLWDSLNFVKKSDVLDHVAGTQGIRVEDDLSIKDIIRKRLADDPVFVRKHGVFALLFRWLYPIIDYFIFKNAPSLFPFIFIKIYRV